ncbi:MAG: hypothetical protein R3D00_31520 [Bacteroidia bacterium]
MEHYQEDLDRLFRGEMPKAEREQFLKRMETDSELAEAFRFQETMILALADQVARENYEKSKTEPAAQNKRLRNFPRLYIYFAAASVVFIGVSFFVKFLFSNSQFPDGINYELRPMTEVKGDGAEGLIAHPESMGDFQQNLRFLVKEADSDSLLTLDSGPISKSETVRRYYAGVNYLYAPAPTKDLEKAEKYLLNVARHGEEMNDRLPAWLQLSVLYHEKGDQDRAIQALREVTRDSSNPENKYYRLALKNLDILSP